MKKIVCNRCGCKSAVDFVVRILCPIRSCINYDKKLADEFKEKSLEIDFLAGDDGQIYSDFSLDDLIAGLDLDLDDNI